MSNIKYKLLIPNYTIGSATKRDNNEKKKTSKSPKILLKKNKFV